VVELAPHGAAQPASAARGRERDVLVVPALMLRVAMVVPGEGGVGAVGQHGLDLQPIRVRLRRIPERLVDQHEGPAHVTVFGQHLLRERELIGLGEGAGHRAARVVHHAEQLGVERQEEHVAVAEVVVGRAEALLPLFGHDRVAHVVVAGHVEEGHLQPVHEALDLVPLVVEHGGVVAVALDQIAHAHHEVGAYEVDLGHRACEDAIAVLPGPVRHDHEAKLVLAEGLETCPGHLLRRALDPGVDLGAAA
jgi:hypothetical protein